MVLRGHSEEEFENKRRDPEKVPKLSGRHWF
jgi:hypothetical protein